MQEIGEAQLGRPGQHGSCEALGLKTVSQGLCTHGTDPAPPGVNPAIPAQPVAPGDVSTQAITCVGNGTDGNRVQVIYAVASDKTNRYSTYAASFASLSAAADQVYRDSAAKTGGSRYIRFVTDANCNISILNETLSTTGDDSFNNVVNELTAKGYNMNTRKYLIFLDNTDPYACGIGSLYGDDHPDPAWNASDSY